MIVKAIIESKISKNKYKVRVPILDKIKGASLGSDNLSIADICLSVNSDLNFNINDVVYLNYENNDKSKPVIIGCLSKNNKSNFIFDSLIINNFAKLSNNIKIGDITYKELSCLIGSNDLIEDQIISLNNNLLEIENDLKENNNNINTINNNINNINLDNEQIDLNILNINSTIGDIDSSANNSFYGRYNDLLEKSNKLSNFVGKSDTTLSSTIENLITRLIDLSNYAAEQVNHTEEINNSQSNDYTYYDDNTAETIEELEEINESIWSNSSEFKDIINALRRKFPDGKYWNHSPRQGNTASNNINNQDGYTDTPCPKHHNCGTSTQTCNGYAPNGVETSWQCMGYANKCGYDVTGYDPEWSSMWKKTTDSNDLKKLKGGDIIRYKNDGHSIYVIAVNGSTITYTDCNSDGHCKIRWDAKIDKSDVKKSFTYIRISPKDLSKSRLIKH